MSGQHCGETVETVDSGVGAGGEEDASLGDRNAVAQVHTYARLYMRLTQNLYTEVEIWVSPPPTGKGFKGLQGILKAIQARRCLRSRGVPAQSHRGPAILDRPKLTCVCVRPSCAASSARSGSARYWAFWKRRCRAASW